MKVKEHFKSCFKFWKPSVATKITKYFLLFGLIIFVITSALHMVAAKKRFRASASTLVQHQFSQLKNSSESDFLWKGRNQPQPELYDLLEILTTISAGFFSVTEISILCKVTDRASWFRLFFAKDQILQAGPIYDSSIKKLERRLKRHFGKSDLSLINGEDALSMFVNITGEADINDYFLKIEINEEGIAAFMRKEVIYFIATLLIALILSRFLGYYFARKIAKPIEALSGIAADVARGDLTQTAPVTSNDEIGELSKSFNKMIEGLREWERIKLIEFEMEKGQQIQREFLPSKLPQVPNWDIATCFYPAGKVAGDFYDVFMLPDGCVGLVIADVCDKGVGSALYMALFRSLIRVFSMQALADPSSNIDKNNVAEGSNLFGGRRRIDGLNAVAYTNNYIANNHDEECMFATLFFGVLNPATGGLSYINGGHEPLYVVAPNGIKAMLKPTGPAVGMMPDIEFKVKQIQLEPGDVLVGYTDGVTEARSPEDETFSRKRLQTLLEQPISSASTLLDNIKRNLFSFIDIAPRSDDVTMLAIQRTAIG